MTRVWNQVSRLAVVFVMLLGLLAMGPLASAAPGGNSAAARACQQGGYTELVGVQDGVVTSFTDVGDCVRYAAQVGQVVNRSIIGPCLDGGYAGLARSEDNRTAFTSQEACVIYVAGGGTPGPVVVPQPSLTVTILASSNPRFCALNITLSNFAPNTTYDVDTVFTSARFGTVYGSYRNPVTTDASGNYGPANPVGTFEKGPYNYTVTAGGITMGPATYIC